MGLILPTCPSPMLPSSVNGIICSGQKPRSHPRFLFPLATPLTRFCWLCLQNTSQYKMLSSFTCTTAMAFFPALHSLCSILHTDARVIPFSCCLKPLNSSHLESKIQIPYIPYSGPPSRGLALPIPPSPSPLTTLCLTNCAPVMLTSVFLKQTKLIAATCPLH